jgi:hypothetical protein
MRLEGWATSEIAAILRHGRESALLRMRSGGCIGNDD